MLEDNMKAQLRNYLTKVVQPVELVATLDQGARSAELKALTERAQKLSEAHDEAHPDHAHGHGHNH